MHVEIDKYPGPVTTVIRLLKNIGHRINYLFASASRQACLLNAVPAQIALLNKHGDIVAVNNRWKNFEAAGQAKNYNGRVGDNYVKLARNAAADYEPIGRELADGIVEVLSGSRQEFVHEYALPASVETTCFQVRVSPMIYGKARGAVLMQFDISEYKLAEEKIRKSEANHAAIIEHTGASVYSIDINLRFITFNSMLRDSLKAYYGVEVKPGDSALDFLEKADPEEAKAWKIIYIEAISGKPLQFVRDYSKPGKPLYVNFSINPIRETGRVIGLSCLARNVTRKKLAGDELRASEQRFRHISKNPIIGIIWISPEGKVLNANEAIYNMLGYYSPELIDKHFSVYTHADDIQLQQDVINRLFAGQKISDGIEKRYIKKNGEALWGMAFFSAVRNEEGKVKYIIGLMHDITATKRMEAELVSLNESLETKIKERTAELQLANSELESFNYTVSHDLQAPLRVVDGYSKILVRNYADKIDDTGKEYLLVISRTVKRMAELVKDLLALSKVGKALVVKTEVKMNDLVKLIADETKITYAGYNYQLEIKELPSAYCDGGLMRQVWTNLISNAVKYSKDKEGAFIEVGSLVTNGQPTYYVRDNGAGFDMKNAHKLFGAFQRLHTQAEFEGTGVGLSLVHTIIKKHGGEIWADAKPGEGATFYFTITTGDNLKS